MDKLKLGKLEKVKLRDVWKHEALSFTKWLAKEENILNLSQEIGIDIEVVQIEASVGSFNVDILAREIDSDRKIIIENQLEKTDHDHLGKLITYASGHDAKIILWIVGEAREEHEKAIEWLNENMNEDIKFFLIVIEVWKIGDSPYAPKFQVVSQPNNWAKTIKSASNKGELTDTKSLQLEFSTKFNCYSFFSSFNFPRVIVIKPSIRMFYLESINNFLLEHSIFVSDTITMSR